MKGYVLGAPGWMRAEWGLPDRNPMPHITISPRLDRALAYWDEARWAVRVASAVLRHGYGYEDHLRCGDHR